VNYPKEKLKFKGTSKRKLFSLTDSSSSNSSQEDEMISTAEGKISYNRKRRFKF
jgi:hypothetical protein